MNTDLYLQSVAEVAHEALIAADDVLSSVGFVASKELMRSGGYAELTVYFTRGPEIVDVIQAEVLRNEQPVATVQEVRDWLIQSVNMVVDDARSAAE
jgi:hypothetical protein